MTSEWTGTKGRVGAWYLGSPLRRLSEVLFLGDVRSAFLKEVSDVIGGGDAVLDVGAGSGYFSLEIAERLRDGRVICLDLSQEMLDRLEVRAGKRGLMGRVQILKGEASSIKVEDRCVNLAVSNGVFHELAEPEAVLGEMVRSLKPGGRVIVTDFRDTRVGRRIGAAHSDEAHGPFSVAELRSLFAGAGLRNTRVYPVKHWVVGVGAATSYTRKR